MRGKERQEIAVYHPDGEIPGTSVEFGARLDDEKTQAEIDERKLGIVEERSNGDGRQLIVKEEKEEHVPLPIRWKLIGAAFVGAGTIYGSYRLAKWLLRATKRDHWEINNKKQNLPK